MAVFKRFSDTFWNGSLWLPPNTSWEDVAPGKHPGNLHTNPFDLLYSLPMTCLILILKYLFQTYKMFFLAILYFLYFTNFSYCFTHIGKHLSISPHKAKQVHSNSILEKAYMTNLNNLKQKEMHGLAKQIDWPVSKVEQWLHLRWLQDQPSPLTKFCETSWQATYALCSGITNLIVLWDTEWLWDVRHCWTDFPHQSISSAVWWCYIINLAYCWSLFFSHYLDLKRKDFWEMLVHHIVTIILFCTSWVCNITRYGSLILVVHDFGDIFSEVTRIAKYAGHQKLYDRMFMLCTLIWIFTRLGVFPMWIIKSLILDAPENVMRVFVIYNVFGGLLILLFVMHIYWSYLMLGVVWKNDGNKQTGFWLF